LGSINPDRCAKKAANAAAGRRVGAPLPWRRHQRDSKLPEGVSGQGQGAEVFIGGSAAPGGSSGYRGDFVGTIGYRVSSFNLAFFFGFTVMEMGFNRI